MYRKKDVWQRSQAVNESSRSFLAEFWCPEVALSSQSIRTIRLLAAVFGKVQRIFFLLGVQGIRVGHYFCRVCTSCTCATNSFPNDKIAISQAVKVDAFLTDLKG